MATNWVKQWADGKGLKYVEAAEIPPYTPTLSGADSSGVVSGMLPGGAEGELALQSYRVDNPDSSYHIEQQTVCVIDVPETMAFVHALYCRDASFKHKHVYELGGDGFKGKWKNEQFESENVDRKWAIQADPDQDEIWLRRLFDPVFLDWLGEHAPQDFVWELVDGKLCGSIHGPASDGAQLEQLSELTAHVAERARSEALEQAHTGAPTGDLPAPRSSNESDHIAKMVARVGWEKPPADMAEAVRAYVPAARREPGGWWPAIILAGGIGLGCLVITVPLGLLLFSDSAFLLYIFVGFAVLLGGLLFIASRSSQIDKRATVYGRQAFIDQYAASRHLTQEDPRAFLTEFMRVEFPGRPISVMAGVLPGTRQKGRLLLCPDPAGGIAFQVVMLPTTLKKEGPADGAGTGTTARVEQGQLLVYSKVDGKVGGATAAGLDGLCKTAAQFAATSG